MRTRMKLTIVLTLVVPTFAISANAEDFDWRTHYDAMSPAEQEGFYDDGTILSRHRSIAMLEELRETLFRPMSDDELWQLARASCGECGEDGVRSFFDTVKSIRTEGRQHFNDEIRQVLYDVDGSYRAMKAERAKANSVTPAQVLNKLDILQAQTRSAERRQLRDALRELSRTSKPSERTTR